MTTASKRPFELSSKRPGRVTLVGAGPGDAELLTLKAMKALQSADVILFDALVSVEVLDLAKREARRLLVGKRGHRPSCRQEDINEMMLKLARQGKHVVRLKAGDPSILGRAGEEIAILEANGIEVTIVPGISSASAMAASLGVSLTHRDCAKSVRFITGHAKSGALPGDLNWKALADPATTLIVYMGARTSRELAGRLIAAGIQPSIPVVAVSSVSRDNEQRWTGPLCGLVKGIAQLDPASPVLIGIGQVFAYCRETRQLQPAVA